MYGNGTRRHATKTDPKQFRTCTLGIRPRTALGIVALLALAYAPATPFVRTLTQHLPESVATGIGALAPVRSAEAAGRPAARPEEFSRSNARSEPDREPDRSDVVESAIPRQNGDLACLAEAVYFEARGTGTQGETAVAHVVVNRAKSDSFPDSVCGVVHDGCQFSYRCDGRSDALAEPAARARAYKVAQTVLEGAPDTTSGALYFHSAKAKGGFKGRKKVGVIGGNVFYR